MTRVREINQIDQLADYRLPWRSLLEQTAGASFFQSLEWLEAYWKHFGAERRLRVLIVSSSAGPIGILPLVVQVEPTKVGRFRVLTYPLHDWGSFYGPIGPDPGITLAAGLEHVRRSRRDWDILELRWVGAAGTDPVHTERAMREAGFQAYQTIWDRTAVVDLSENWNAYFASRNAAWRNNFHRRQKKLARQGELRFLRHRPDGCSRPDADPRWDLYDACERIATRSWQADATNGTTLSDESIRPFLREVHALAAEAGAVDLNLLLLDEEPTAFIYNYHYRGYVYGLRLGYDPARARDGTGSLLCGLSIRDSFQRGDRIYDMGVGSLDSKRDFQTGVIPIFRYSHFCPTAVRTQLLRVKRWVQVGI